LGIGAKYYNKHIPNENKIRGIFQKILVTNKDLSF